MIKDFKKKLRTGDIILFHGHHWLSKIIQNLDNSHFNHCAIYAGYKDNQHYIYEAIEGGIQYRTLDESIEDSESSIVSINRLKNAPEDMQKVIDKIEELRKHKTHYSLTQMVLLAGILLKKKITFNRNLFDFTHKYLIYTIDKFEKIIDSENKNLVCSEFIYRAYNEINDPSYEIHLDHKFSLRDSPIPIFGSDEDQKLIKFEIEVMQIQNSSNHPIEKCMAYEKICAESVEKMENILEESTKTNHQNADIATKTLEKKELLSSFSDYLEESKIVSSIKKLHKQTCNLEISDSLNNRIQDLKEKACSIYEIHPEDNPSEIPNENINALKAHNGDLYDPVFDNLEMSNFITPGDIERAFNLEEIDRIRIHKFIDNDCNLCN